MRPLADVAFAARPRAAVHEYLNAYSRGAEQMLKHLGSPFRARRLEFGGGGRMDYLFAGGLILLIVLALGLTIWHTFKGSSPTTEQDPDMHFKCGACGGEFTIPREQYYSAEREQEDEAGRIDCKLCGARESAYPMTKCPNCGKYYLSERQKAIIDSMADRGQPPRNIGQIPDKCPHCGTDRIQWLREHQ
jgi:DNA-directed RNA polymerase subunit RPC12/RpoP